MIQRTKVYLQVSWDMLQDIMVMDMVHTRLMVDTRLIHHHTRLMVDTRPSNIHRNTRLLVDIRLPAIRHLGDILLRRTLPMEGTLTLLLIIQGTDQIWDS